MDDALLVRRGQAAGNLLRVVDGFARGERAIAQAVAKGLAFEQFGDDVGRAVVFADIVDGKNVGMVERGGGAGFLGEALQAFGIGGEGSGENFDGDVAVEAGSRGRGRPRPCRQRRLAIEFRKDRVSCQRSGAWVGEL